MTRKMYAAGAVAWSALVLPALASAQTIQPTQAPTPLTDARRLEVERQAAAAGGRLVATVETRVTPGRPYSAEAVTESLQVLGDGNRISRRSSARVFRDGQGRTRREQLGNDNTADSITISDPVGGASFTLDPTRKLAARSNVLVRTASGQGRGLAPTVAASEQEARRRREGATAAQVEMSETSREASSQMRQVLERAASGGGTTTKENLGEQQIEGVRATGTRSTTVIPPGALGNLQEIRIVSEQWFSPDLEVLVLTRHSDPRVGDTIYKLTQIVRAEPDPSLFIVPADYTITTRGVRQPQ